MPQQVRMRECDRYLNLFRKFIQVHLKYNCLFLMSKKYN